MDWLEAAFGFGDEAEPAETPAKPPRHAPKIESCVAVVRHPSHEGDLGEAVDCNFFVDDGTVVLCTPSGKPTGEEKHLAPGDDPRSVAKRLRRDTWRREQNKSERVPGFDRPLRYRDIVY
jgi:hypothetical protein